MAQSFLWRRCASKVRESHARPSILWTRCGNNGKSREGRKKGKRIPKKKRHHLLSRMTRRRKAMTRRVKRMERRKRGVHATIVRRKVTSRRIAGRSIQIRCQRSRRRRMQKMRNPKDAKDAKSEKAGALVKEDEHLLSLIDIKANDDVEYEFYNDTEKGQVTIEFGLVEDDFDDDKSDGSKIVPTIQGLNSPNIWIGDTGATKYSTSSSRVELIQGHC
jgi:hypothetical protein